MGIPSNQYKQRHIRTLPGRARIEVFGLKRNINLAQSIIKRFSRRDGINNANPCIDTGRMLISYDETIISLPKIIEEIELLEAGLIDGHNGMVIALSLSGEEQPSLSQPAISISSEETAVTLEGVDMSRGYLKPISEGLLAIFKPNASSHGFPATTNTSGLAGERVPLSLTLSVGGLAVLGIKQLLFGKSSLAKNSTAFNLAALVAVTSGYPLLKRAPQQFTANKQWNSELFLGAGALALALMRENLVVLAGLSILHYAKWKRQQMHLAETDRPQLPAEIKDYSERAGKVNTLLAVTTWAVTGDPLRGMAVLLAGNPRVATLPAQYTLEQAEIEAKEKGYYLPEHCSLYDLSRIKTVVFTDTSLMVKEYSAGIQCIADKENEAKVWHLAASLMRKTKHPWQEQVTEKAQAIGGTPRTAFKVEQTEHGIKAKVQGIEVLMGSIRFLEQNGVDCDHYLLEVKRKQRAGYDVLCLAKDKVYLGSLLKHRENVVPEFLETINFFHQNNIKVGVLNNSLNLEAKVLLQNGIDPHTSTGAFSVSVSKLEDLIRSMEYAFAVNRAVQQHFRIAKAWNALGAVLTIPLVIAAPVANLLTDALTLLLLARSKRLSENHGFTSRGSEFKPEAKHSIIPRTNKNNINQPLPGKPSEFPWHAVAQNQILQEFKVNERRGLTSEQVLALKQRYGFNQLDQKKPEPWLFSYLEQFKEFTTLVVLGTSVLALVSGDWFDGLAMGAILLANAAIGTVQERKAERVIEALNQFQSPSCKVIREDKILEIMGTDLVPGDIVSFEAGDRVPTDLRLLEGWNLEVNEAALTGESLPVGKASQVLAEDCPLAERKNMLYMGTDITRGKGIGIVVRTGMETEIGYLMSLMKGQEKVATPLHEKVTSISKAFVKGAALAGAIVFITGLLRGRPVRQMITTSITLAASAVPEGLPVTITIALSAGIYRMAKKDALIRKLSALETLGRTTVICTDKTGTLTKNEMTVKRIATLDQYYDVSGNGYEPAGAITMRYTPDSAKSISGADIESNPELQQLARISVLCNNSKLEQEHEYWSVMGDPTEGALLTLAAKFGLWTNKMTHWHRVHEVPFDSNSGTMSVVCKDTQTDQDCYVFCKGSVEAIFDHCQWYQENGEVYPLTEKQKKVIYEQNELFARDALRVLAFAYCPTEWMEGEPKVLDDELIYVGLVGMMDPPKPEVEKSIREAYTLGVKPVMITGDHPITAIAIAKELGIGGGNTRVLTGKEMDELSDDELVGTVENISIFARVTPEHKLRIVTAYQKCGHIVAMTGDGVNDTPAIKQSNVGIAMGRTGTEVTKATADMVLKKDHFGSILEGVKEGRTIIGNIRKAIGCLLTGNLAEILVTGVAVIVGLPMPLVPIQILLMNLLTDAIPAAILAVNPGNKTKQSKRQDIVDKELYQKVITRGVLLGAGSLGLFALSLAAGAPLAVAQTAAFTALVVGQLVQTLSWRQEGSAESMRDSLKDRYLVSGLGASFLALLAAIYVPSLARFFHTAPLMPQHWLPILFVAGSVSLLSRPFLHWVSGKGTGRQRDGSFVFA
ncbi:MAG: HAD-IC family P-type ATPase [Desulfitobacteriaceae bacterium]